MTIYLTSGNNDCDPDVLLEVGGDALLVLLLVLPPPPLAKGLDGEEVTLGLPLDELLTPVGRNEIRQFEQI
jgi:hypothetical protein